MTARTMTATVTMALAIGLFPLPARAETPKAAPPAAKATAPAPTKVVTVEGITEYRLDNGLRVLLFPDATKPTVTVNVTYFVGSRHEGYGESGMAHLLEHLLFKGTATRDNILGLLQARGAMANGTTDYDRTNYYEVLPAIPGNLEFALELEADRMLGSRIAKVDLDKEFTVVRNEFEMGENQPDQVLEERMLSTAFLWHNYGKSPIGSRADIERVPIEALKAFYQRYYQPDNAMLVIAGKVDPAAALALVQKNFGGLPRPSRKLVPTYTVEPVQDGERSVTLRRTGDVAVIGVAYHALPGSHEDFVAERALVDALVAKPSGRLYKALVEKGLAAEVHGDAYPLTDPGFIDLFASVRTGQSVEKAQAALVRTIEELGAATGPGALTDEDVKRFQAKALKGWELAMTRSDRIGVELSEYAAQGDWRLLFVYRDRLKQLDLARMRRVAGQFLKPTNRTLGQFLPTKSPDRAPLPVPVDVAALVKGYVGQADLAQGEEFAATLDNIEKRTETTALPNGMKLALLSKKTRGGSVKLVLQLHFGSEKDLAGKLGAAGQVRAMLVRGTRKHTYQQIKDSMDRLKMEIQGGDDGPGSGSPDAAALSVTTVREHLPEVIALLGELTLEPIFPKDQFEILRKEGLAGLEKQLQNPQMRAFIALQRKANPYPKDNVRYVPTVEERIDRLKAVKAPEIAAFHKAFWGGNHAELAVVGDFDAGEVKAAATKAFGAWKSLKPYQRIASTFQAGLPGGEETIQTDDKEMAMIVVGNALDLKDDDADYPAARIGNYVLGGGFKSRLVDRLRQKEGLSYGAFSGISADARDRFGFFYAGAICAPQNADKAMAAMLEEIDRLRKDGVPAPELEEAKKGYLLSFDNRLAQDEYVAGQLASNLHLDRTFDYHRKTNARIRSMTPQELAPVLAKVLAPGCLVKVKAGNLKPAK
ncbi:MAG: insulinase family protein [Myxococcales bacterium]|nr:insulinase family protein [Myxococcales bacterium]